MRFSDIKIVETQVLEAEGNRTLQTANLNSNPPRFQNLINNIRSRHPLYLVDGTPVIIMPAEADRLEQLKADQMFKGQIKLTAEDKQVWVLSQFLKTKDYGGQAVPPGQEAEVGMTKEAAALKPSDIGLEDRQIQAGNLAQEIVNNPNLQKTDHGKIVIEMANEIMQGQMPAVPKVDAAVSKAINDYAGEYLGVLALVEGVSEFPNKKDFDNWLKAPIGSLTLVFPGKANAPLADSYALIDPTTGHQLNISSKGKGGGAPPSIGSLEVPKHLRDKPQYSTAIRFIELIKDRSLPAPTTMSQVFEVMNLIHEVNTGAIDAKFAPFLPWSTEKITELLATRKEGTPLPEYEDLWSNYTFKGDSTDIGKLVYALKNECMQALNNGAIPDFAATVLEILDYNFIQQDAKIVRGIMQFKTQWPAKLNATVTVESKSGATDMTKGSFSFKLHF
jgi:hypothetical protein